MSGQVNPELKDGACGRLLNVFTFQIFQVESGVEVFRYSFKVEPLIKLGYRVRWTRD